MQTTTFLREFLACSPKNMGEIFCYGIGDFTTNSFSLSQLSFLILLQQHFKIPTSLYDPIFFDESVDSTLIQAILTKYNLQLLTENEECKRIAKTPTLFFIPHGEKFMYRNVIETNQQANTVNNLTIFGNSFASIKEATELSRSPTADELFLSDISSHTMEKKFDYKSEGLELEFNNTVLITFSQ
jgi:hypothetical protein